MKKILLGAAVALTMVACKTETKETTTTPKKETTDVVTKTDAKEGNSIAVNLKESTVWYKGSKSVGNDSHEGFIPLKSANFFMTKDGKLTGGEFVLNMADMTNTDIKDAKKNAMLLDHLKNADFFDVEKFPTASFKLTSVEQINENGEHKLTGDLIIKGKTEKITVPAIVKKGDDGKVSMTTDFTFNRTKFGIEYNSSLTDIAKDKLIKDKVEVKVSAVSK